MAHSEGQAAASACNARIELSPLVPEGRTMVEVELPDETVIVVRQGLMDAELVDEWNRHWAEATHNGRWRRSDYPFDEPKGHPGEE